MAWLTGWNRRKSKIVNNLTVADYQMKLIVYQSGLGPDTAIDIYLGGHIRSDFSDLRFTGPDQTTLLYYWIESISSGVATVWVKVPTLTPTNNIYVYYDNPTMAMSLSDGSNTFDFFDDFETYPLNQTIIGQNGWFNGYGSNNQNMLVVNDAVYSGSQSLRGYSGGTSRQDAEKSMSFSSDIFFEFSIRTDKSTSATYDWVFYIIYGSSGDIGHMGFGRQYDGLGGYIIYYNGSSYVAIQPYTQNTWYRVGITIKFSTQKLDYWIDGVKKVADTNLLSASASTNRIIFDVYSGAGSSDNAWLDAVRIRKYTSSEPTFGASGTEETPAFITTTNMEIVTSQTPCLQGICTVTVTVTWQNQGTATGSFVPSLTIDGSPIVPQYPSENLGPGASVTHAFDITNLAVGDRTICPNPN